MERPQKKPFSIRFLRFIAWPVVFLLTPAWAIIRGAGKTVLPTKIPAEQLKLFSELTPAERWEIAREIQGWSDQQLLQERKISCWLAYLFVGCSVGVLVSIVLSLSYLSIIQITSYMAYSAGFFLLFAKKSMRVYAIDRRQIILFGEWFRLPVIWVPTATLQEKTNVL